MNIETQNQRSFWNGKALAVMKMNFRCSFEFDWKVFGVGILLFKPIYRKFPRKNHWFGIPIRIFWISLMLKFVGRKPNEDNHEYFEKMELNKELSAFYSKDLIAFQNNSALRVSWSWYTFGLMVFCDRRQSFNQGHYSLSVLWASIGKVEIRKESSTN